MPDTVILIGPNHTGIGRRCPCIHGSWLIPEDPCRRDVMSRLRIAQRKDTSARNTSIASRSVAVLRQARTMS
jgi:predicted class III extradiol MEMO1 family dioxygenase